MASTKKAGTRASSAGRGVAAKRSSSKGGAAKARTSKSTSAKKAAAGRRGAAGKALSSTMHTVASTTRTIARKAGKALTGILGRGKSSGTRGKKTS